MSEKIVQYSEEELVKMGEPVGEQYQDKDAIKAKERMRKLIIKTLTAYGDLFRTVGTDGVTPSKIVSIISKGEKAATQTLKKAFDAFKIK